MGENSIALFSAVFAVLWATHTVADHWVQAQTDADAKGLPGWPGRLACARHVATYTATAVAGLAVAGLYLGLAFDLAATTAGLGISAVSHYIADRREPLRRIADALGKRDFYGLKDFGLNGSYLLDQSWHVGFLCWAALVVAGGTERLALTAVVAVAVTGFLGYKVACFEHQVRSVASAAPVSPAVEALAQEAVGQK